MVTIQKHRAQLKALTTALLDEQSTDLELTNALDQFLLLCSHGSDIVPSLSFSAHSGDTELQQGVAINPAAAAQCAKDYKRTVVFVRGLYTAIRDRLSNAKQPIRLLYAGCGPYATVLLPLLSIIEPKYLDIHLLDIHEESLLSVQQLIQYFQLDKVHIKYLCENACEYQDQSAFDIILTETMQKALEQEPQFLVTANLVPQLKSDGIFLPAEINIDLCLREAKQPTTLLRLNRIMSLTPKSVASYLSQIRTTNNKTTIELSHIEIPEPCLQPQFDYVLSTQLVIYKQLRLNDNEAEITLITKQHEMDNAKSGELWHIRYRLGSYPQFEFSQLTDN